jgi:hypothetical protein
MSETQPDKKPASAGRPGPETQQERWMKYGANVVLVSVIVVVLGIVVSALAQSSRFKSRIDTTHAGLYSLKPQTKAFLKDLKQNVRIVSLYRTKPAPGQEKDYFDVATPVADLLEEYKDNSNGKIEVEVIDPIENPSKVDDLITQVTERYGGEVKQYRDFLAGYDKVDEQARKLVSDEVAAVTSMTPEALAGSKLGQLIVGAKNSVEDVLKDFDISTRNRTRQIEDKPPNYRGAVDAIRSDMERFSAIANAVTKQLTVLKDEKGPPENAVKYAAAAVPRYQAMAKVADDTLEKIKGLGTLKLDDLREQLKAHNGIIVMGAKDMRVLTFEQVWQDDPNMKRMLATAEKKLNPQFAGEQQVTSAILALTQENKPKVAFVRAGGPPLTTAGGFFGPPPGDLSRVAARLREYNFEVLEKDLTGMWAMQSQMQQRGMPPEPEPDDAAIKDAIWIVAGTPAQPGPMGAPPQISSKVAEHLKAGGSALFLCAPEGEDMAAALADYGIKVRTDAIVVHEPVPAEGGATGDFVNEAQRNPFVFVVREYGNHMLTEPVRSLDMPLIAAVPVSTEPKTGIKQWGLIPVPMEPKTWGETNIEALKQGDATVKYDAAADVAAPLFAGAAAQKEQGEGRVIVLGTFRSATNDILRWPDAELYERTGKLATLFPGAMELFNNCVFWLAKMEPMIAISPAAMDVSRIEPMSKGGQWFWRNGVLLIGMPLLVIVAGALMYVRRRD